MLYKKNTAENLSKELFMDPTSEYRGTPFWAWNCRLDRDMLLRRIDQLKEMGMGGFHIHSRSGMATPYLSDEFMELVKACNEKAKKEGMLCWLYDEDRWPSGTAGGKVTSDPKYSARFLLFTPRPYKKDCSNPEAYENPSGEARDEFGYLLAKYQVLLKDGYLASYKKLDKYEEAAEGTTTWWAYLEPFTDNPWFNNHPYVNTLNKEAIKRFVEITHERYFEKLGEDFGGSIPAIFTDEPQFPRKGYLGFAEEMKDVALPFTDDFSKTYEDAYGENIMDYLPELFWELPDGRISTARYRYHDHISERFAQAFADTVGDWCREHNIMLTGHLMDEPTLMSQTKALGDAMRSYRSFQLPGIDMLCDWREYSTAKQAQSAAHQYGCPGVLSELYGVTNWDFDFRNHKLAGDWQAALGVTTRVHHLSWVSMGGEAKRDYPASLGYQSPWYKEYPMIENHFSRLNTALTRGKPHVRIGVIHPVESYWLYWGPFEQTAVVRDELEKNFDNTIKWLLFGQLDFDFISESLLPEQNQIEEKAPFTVGEMKYDVIIVPGCHTLRSSTVERLEAFKRAGGEIIFAGKSAWLVDAIENNRVEKLAEECTNIPFTRGKLLESLEKYRCIDIGGEDGARTDNLFYQMRADGDKYWLFICHAEKPKNQDIAELEKVRITIAGEWKPVVYDTLSGQTYNCEAHAENGRTVIDHEFWQYDSLLLLLEPGKPILKPAADKKSISESKLEKFELQPLVPVTLSEPNVLLLDMAEYSHDGGQWNRREEILRIDNDFRRKLGYPLRMEAMAQPWVNPSDEKPEHTLGLKFKICSDIEVKEPYLALENPENTEIIVNGKIVPSNVYGWFTDEAIKKVKLPDLPAGNSEIILNIAFGPKTNVEWCYLLGDFGVNVRGSLSKIISPIRELAFGDWTSQGLPFYAGNLTYHCTFEVEEDCELEVEVPQFRNPLLKVSFDGNEIGNIAWAPYTVKLGKVEKGSHTLNITAFGNRINAFGAVHNCDRSFHWFGPRAWRTSGSRWSYEYQLKATGILIAPRICEIK